jgi:hypothetical protein
LLIDPDRRPSERDKERREILLEAFTPSALVPGVARRHDVSIEVASE